MFSPYGKVENGINILPKTILGSLGQNFILVCVLQITSPLNLAALPKLKQF